MLNKPIGLMVAMMFSACASSQQPTLPPPPSQPEVVDQEARSVDSGFLLSFADERDALQRAEAGDRDAAFRLSLHFMSAGDQVQKKHWQLIAAQNGHSVAQYNQWFDLKNNRDCASMTEALIWLKAAAEGGSEDAQGKLAEYTQVVRSCTP